MMTIDTTNMCSHLLIIGVCAIIEPLKTALWGIKTWCAKNEILHTMLIFN